MKERVTRTVTCKLYHSFDGNFLSIKYIEKLKFVCINYIFLRIKKII